MVIGAHRANAPVHVDLVANRPVDHHHRRTVAQRIASECLGRRARLLSRVVTRLFDEELRDHELKGSQLTLLVALALSPGLTARVQGAHPIDG